ncbi:MAG: TRAP transporter permease [Desulfatiglandales bacterium]
MEKAKKRSAPNAVPGWINGYRTIILALIPISALVFLLRIPFFLGVDLYIQQYFGLVFGLMIAAALLLFPWKKGGSPGPSWLDLLLSVLALVCGIYITVNYKILAVESGLITPTRIVLGCLAVLLILEAARRVVGWAFVVIVLVFLFYALFSSLLPEGINMESIPWDSLACFLYLDPQGILGIPLKVAVTIVLVFILFGQIVQAIGGGKVFIDMSFSLMGKYRGGPAKVAIIGSSLFGSISGSAVANVATTGVFTIPMMKEAGYKPYFAGAVESVASTGGQIMPPIMGAAAFLMATFLGIPYSEIALAALVPAILYYISVFIQVDLRASKEKLTGLPREQLPHMKNVLKDGWTFVLPFLILIFLLFVWRLEPEIAGLFTGGLALFLGFLFKKRTGLSLQNFFALFSKTGRALIEVGVTSAGAGIIIGVLSITGLGFIFSNLLVSLAQGSVFLLLVMAAVGAVILGMGMTVTAAYLLMVVLIAPALVDIGISALLAHFFVFYFAVLSFLTPPVCMAAYAAASIAEAKMLKTALQAMRLGISAYVVPFIFAYRPSLLLQGSAMEVIVAISGALVGVAFLSFSMEGYLFRELNWLKRVIFLVGGLLVLVPDILSDSVGLAMTIPILILEWRSRGASRATNPATPVLNSRG